MTYEETVARIADKTSYKFIQLEDSNQKRLCALLIHDGGSIIRDILRRADEELRCQSCRGRLKRLCRYSNGKKPLLFSPATKALTDPLSIDLRRMNALVLDTPVVGIKIFSGRNIDGFDEVEGPFSHYHARIPHDQMTTADQDSVILYNKAIRRYVPDILPRMIRTIIPDKTAMDGMIASLDLMRSCLDAAAYGRMLMPSVEWLTRVVHHFGGLSDQYNMRIECARILLWTAISPDGLHDAVSPVIQQAIKNVIPIMADAKNEAAMKAMLTDRLSPQKYQRPSTTKVIKPGQVMNAMSTLGDFTNRLMTWEEASRMPNTIVFEEKGSMHSFKQMLSPPTKKTPYKFAERSAVVSTLKDLFGIPPGSRLEIQTTSMSPCYLATTTLSPTVLSVPHLWAFMNSTSPSSIGMKQWESVCGIVRIEYQQHRNYVLILQDTSGIKTRTFPNCCFPTFLSIQHRRTCGDAFERLNKTMKLVVPSDTHVAVGIGVSVSDTKGTLHKPITVRVNGGSPITIRSSA